MNRLRWTIIALLALAVAEVAFAQKCPLSGKTANKRIQAANVLKNRSAIPLPSDFDSAFTIDSVLAPGNDTARWNEKKAGRLTAWVFNVKPGGVESVNCGAKAIPDRDTHIELVRSLSDTAKPRRIIVEITPRMRVWAKTKNWDWSTPALVKTLKKKHIEVEGWVFYDAEHKPSSESTNPHAKNNWRATPVELHPVTLLRIIE
jgi:hypothetical protein